MKGVRCSTLFLAKATKIPPLHFADWDELDPVEDDISNILCTAEEVK